MRPPGNPDRAALRRLDRATRYPHNPIPFERSIRVSIEHGHGNTQANDYSSVAYWYQELPNKQFPPLPPPEDRLPISDHDSRRRFYGKW